MIGYLKGSVISSGDSTIILDVNGVGYRLRAEKSIMGDVANGGKDLEVFTFTYVREDTLELYGFRSEKSLDLFEKLISISGVGPKMAIGIFGLGTREEITGAIQSADTTFFTSLPKLGKKNAQKIIIELKNKVGGEDIDLSKDDDSKELLSILKNFGFSQKEAYAAIQKVNGKAEKLEDKVKIALKHLGQ